WVGKALLRQQNNGSFKAGKTKGPPLATWLRSRAQRWAICPTSRTSARSRNHHSLASFHMGPVSQRSTLGLSGRAACPQALDQLTCLTAKSADDRASPLPAT